MTSSTVGRYRLLPGKWNRPNGREMRARSHSSVSQSLELATWK